MSSKKKGNINFSISVFLQQYSVREGFSPWAELWKPKHSTLAHCLTWPLISTVTGWLCGQSKHTVGVAQIGVVLWSGEEKKKKCRRFRTERSCFAVPAVYAWFRRTAPSTVPSAWTNLVGSRTKRWETARHFSELREKREVEESWPHTPVQLPSVLFNIRAGGWTKTIKYFYTEYVCITGKYRKVL